ncbi:ATP-binding cassette domain-containing protein [Demequina lutea]|uniref:ABC-type sugar transport system ATPase subunit n=1 Tax=Demequina lutea TaxID=431489 RepID=A0A7Z0CL83_9MICO|nr:ATP-binding cassette domain-containing protein [Demequina lutea]NYI42495.1 ABC-type sugar transport system ATPase subunit [Demequina lutea]
MLGSVLGAFLITGVPSGLIVAGIPPNWQKVVIGMLGMNVPDPRQAVSDLSGGQRQTVAIARSVAWAKRVILLDEPTNHLGPHQSGQVLDVIRRARDKGLGIILISHALRQVLEVTDRIVVVRLGRQVANDCIENYTSETPVRAITGRDA